MERRGGAKNLFFFVQPREAAESDANDNGKYMSTSTQRYTHIPDELINTPLLLNMSAAGMVIIEVMCMGPTKTAKTRSQRHPQIDVYTARMITVHNVTDRVELKYITPIQGMN